MLSVFAGGFDLAAAAAVLGQDSSDEYALLDVVDSLVRKSLVDSGAGRWARPLRPVGDHPPVRPGTAGRHRDHRRDPGPSRPLLRRAGRRPLGHVGRARPAGGAGLGRRRVGQPAGRVPLGRRPARPGHRRGHRRPHRHAGRALQRFEAAGWAEEILEAGPAADLAQLPRLYTAASLCSYTGRPEAAVGYAQAAVALEADARYDPFDPAWTRYREAVAHLLAGRLDRYLEICAGLEGQPGAGHVLGKCGLLLRCRMPGGTKRPGPSPRTPWPRRAPTPTPGVSPSPSGRRGGRFARPDPARALRLFREGLAYAQEHRLLMY